MLHALQSVQLQGDMTYFMVKLTAHLCK